MNAPDYILQFIQTIDYSHRLPVAKIQEQVSQIMKADGVYEGSSYENLGRKFRLIRDSKSHLYNDNIREEIKDGVNYYWYFVEVSELLANLHKTEQQTKKLLQGTLLPAQAGTYGVYLQKL